MRLVNFNVNGIRALDRKGGITRLGDMGGDVVCLQEVRATADQAVEAIAGRLCVSGLAPSEQLGRSGVALLSDLAASDLRIGLPGFADDGRWIEGLFESAVGPVRIVSVYVPKGEVGDPRQQRKMDFLSAMTQRMAELGSDAGSGGPQALVCGDLNVARTDSDLKNWRGNRGRSGTLPEEREFLEHWANFGWVDIARMLAGDVPGPYTWWSQRGRAFDNDAGWRIDYVWGTSEIAGRARAARVDRAPTWDSRWSDHAAVIVDFE